MARIPRPDECYLALATLPDSSRIARAEYGGYVMACGAYLVLEASAYARGERLIGSESPEPIPAAVMDYLVASQGDYDRSGFTAGLTDASRSAIGVEALFHREWITGLLQRLVQAAATDPGMLDRIVPYISSWLGGDL